MTTREHLVRAGMLARQEDKKITDNPYKSPGWSTEVRTAWDAGWIAQDLAYKYAKLERFRLDEKEKRRIG